MTRVGAVQICPEWNAQTEATADTAFGTSQSAAMMPAPLPPSSMRFRFMVLAPCSTIRAPTTELPVKLIMLTSFESTSAGAGLGPAADDQVDDAGREAHLVEDLDELDDAPADPGARA